MAKSNKPIVWSLFAAGGTVTAFVMPVLVLLTLSASLGMVPAGLTYEGLGAIASNWFGKLALFGVLALSFWHCAHRLRVTVHDFGLRADALVATVVYLLAAAGTLGTAFYLLRI
jgi:fumarate reductase subunit D